VKIENSTNGNVTIETDFIEEKVKPITARTTITEEVFLLMKKQNTETFQNGKLLLNYKVSFRICL
jgi:prephenate dehydratase